MNKMNGVRAALLAIGLLLAATPAQAQFGWQFGFGFLNDDRGRFLFPCILTERGLRNAIEDAGYEDIFLNVPNDRRVQARARRGDWIYLLRVDVCTGDILERERLRRAGS
jgi:hypothetical protein